MNFYAFHIGDYASATRHLSWDEDAAYRRLIDAYYVREAPLPLELRQVYRLVMATTTEQREAVETVLREFFAETEDGWRHERCEVELMACRKKKDAAAASANARWGKANASKPHANASENDATASSVECEGNAPNPNPNPNPIEKPSRKRSGFDAKGIELPAWLDAELWGEWVDERKSRGKPITERAAREQIKSLDEYRRAGHTPERTIRHAIASGNQGLYPPPRLVGQSVPAVTVASDDARKTKEMLDAYEMTPEERAKADEAKRHALSSIKLMRNGGAV